MTDSVLCVYTQMDRKQQPLARLVTGSFERSLQSEFVHAESLRLSLTPLRGTHTRAPERRVLRLSGLKVASSDLPLAIAPSIPTGTLVLVSVWTHDANAVTPDSSSREFSGFAGFRDTLLCSGLASLESDDSKANYRQVVRLYSVEKKDEVGQLTFTFHLSGLVFTARAPGPLRGALKAPNYLPLEFKAFTDRWLSAIAPYDTGEARYANGKTPFKWSTAPDYVGGLFGFIPPFFYFLNRSQIKLFDEDVSLLASNLVRMTMCEEGVSASEYLRAPESHLPLMAARYPRAITARLRSADDRHGDSWTIPTWSSRLDSESLDCEENAVVNSLTIKHLLHARSPIIDALREHIRSKYIGVYALVTSGDGRLEEMNKSRPVLHALYMLVRHRYWDALRLAHDQPDHKAAEEDMPEHPVIVYESLVDIAANPYVRRGHPQFGDDELILFKGSHAATAQRYIEWQTDEKHRTLGEICVFYKVDPMDGTYPDADTIAATTGMFMPLTRSAASGKFRAGIDFYDFVRGTKCWQNPSYALFKGVQPTAKEAELASLSAAETRFLNFFRWEPRPRGVTGLAIALTDSDVDDIATLNRDAKRVHFTKSPSPHLVSELGMATEQARENAKRRGKAEQYAKLRANVSREQFWIASDVAPVRLVAWTC